jgi:protein-S-isoprenylcysteine O-methyltransferase Ste14
MLFFRALLAFLALPVAVGGLFPWLLFGIDGWRTRGTVLGWPVFFVGMSVLLWCVRDFYVSGKGTLAPWDPPKRLVVVGLYQFLRNPMYVGVLGCVGGWSLVAGSPLIAAYTGMLAIGFHLRVVLYEEPTLARKFGHEWTRYRATVNRWLPSPTSKSNPHSGL